MVTCVDSLIGHCQTLLMVTFIPCKMGDFVPLFHSCSAAGLLKAEGATASLPGVQSNHTRVLRWVGKRGYQTNCL